MDLVSHATSNTSSPIHRASTNVLISVQHQPCMHVCSTSSRKSLSLPPLDPNNALFQGLPQSFHGCFLLLHKGVAVCTPTKSEAFVDLPESATRFADPDYAQDRDELVSTHRTDGLRLPKCAAFSATPLLKLRRSLNEMIWMYNDPFLFLEVRQPIALAVEARCRKPAYFENFDLVYCGAGETSEPQECLRGVVKHDHPTCPAFPRYSPCHSPFI
jgi:hypothetical protein